MWHYYTMLNRSSKKKRPVDVNELAASIVADAVGDAPEEKIQPAKNGKDPAAVALGRKGGLKGGKARAKKLSPERRHEIAKLAAKARYAKQKKEK